MDGAMAKNTIRKRAGGTLVIVAVKTVRVRHGSTCMIVAPEVTTALILLYLVHPMYQLHAWLPIQIGWAMDSVTVYTTPRLAAGTMETVVFRHVLRRHGTKVMPVEMVGMNAWILP